MSQKTRGLLSIIYKSFISQLKAKPPPKFIGEDYNGTKYFEEERSPTGRKSRGRFFTPADEENFEQDLPAEWESWLRYRRRDPPTKEEVETNYKMIITKRENAAKLEAEFAQKRIGTGNATADSTKSDSLHSSATFPTLEEYNKK